MRSILRTLVASLTWWAHVPQLFIDTCIEDDVGQEASILEAVIIALWTTMILLLLGVGGVFIGIIDIPFAIGYGLLAYAIAIYLGGGILYSEYTRSYE